ncbi:MAG: FISUMP domain-containing protein [Bacteroidales bacterium]|jgi:uncharacterized protein (TIGR02145 family)|nr:FISUMP domain-containing protein [Bacteroidales bacterium]
MKYSKLSFFCGLLISLFLFNCTSKEIKKAKEYIEAAMYEEAITYLELEIQDNPKNAEASFLLGKCYLEIEGHEREKIEKLFNRAILLDDDYRDIIGNIFYDKAIELYKEKKDYKAKEYYEYGLEYFPIATTEFAQKVFDYAVEFSETSTDAGRPIELFRIVDEISPEFKTQIADRTYSLATKLIENGFVNEGFTYADFGIKYDPKHIEDVANLYFEHGKIFAKDSNDINKSIQYLKRSVQISASNNKNTAKFLYELTNSYSGKKYQDLILQLGKLCVELDEGYNNWFLELEERYNPKFTDERDGEIYRYTKIGDQIWMAENLRFQDTYYGGKRYYQNFISNLKKYGYLYNWETAKKVCPDGWHLPSHEEWNRLEDYLKLNNSNAGSLRAKGQWYHAFSDTDSLGFSALPGGHLSENGHFNYESERAYFWTSTQYNQESAWARIIYNNRNNMTQYNFNKKYYFSVRCIKDN